MSFAAQISVVLFNLRNLLWLDRFLLLPNIFSCILGYFCYRMHPLNLYVQFIYTQTGFDIALTV